MKFSERHISRRNFLKSSSLALPFVLLPQLLSAVLLKKQFIHRTVFAMGTTVSIQAYHHNRALLQNAMTKAFNELYRMDDLLSVYKEKSDVSNINHHAGISEVSVHDNTIQILKYATSFSQKTNGVFDPTIEPLMKLWGFRSNNLSGIPSDKKIQETLDAVGYTTIAINQKEKSIGLLNVNSSIDLGGIAVGFCVDRMVEILKSEGVESALINHSGDLFAIGAPPESDGWNIGIPSPTDQSEFITTLTLNNQSVSTSGSYEKYIEVDHKRFGHILDRFTGKPASENLSVSVIADSSLTSDALSTTFFCQNTSKIKSDNIGTKLEIVMVDKQQNVTHLK